MKRSYDYTQRVAREQADFRSRKQKGFSIAGQPARELTNPARNVFFRLEIREELPQKHEQTGPLLVKELKAGRSYILVLTGSLNGAGLEQSMYPQGIEIDDSIELHLQLPPEAQVPPGERKALIDGALFSTLTYHEAKRFQRTTRFTLPGKTPTRTVTFYLRYRESGMIFPVELSQLSVPVQGSYNPEDSQFLAECYINAGLPAHVALLSIDALDEKEERLQLRGWCRQGKLLEESLLIKAEASISIMALREGNSNSGGFKSDPGAIINTLNYFSRTFSPPTTGWLQQISRWKAGQERPCLIIVDNTKREFPWEMLRLEPQRLKGSNEQRQYTYLGAVMQIARWLPFRCFARGRRLRVKKMAHTGSILSYVDSGLGEAKIQPEREALQRLRARPYSTLQELWGSLSKPLPGIGMIYIGCHGRAGRALENASKTSPELQRPSKNLRARDLEMLYTTPDPHLTVFVNACEAARVLLDSLLSRSNFVEGFLTHCAGGFIGPLAPVRITNASQIARNLLLTISAEQGTSIAEALRILREQAVQLLQGIWDLPEDEKDDVLYQVLDTFMYVYYGNPLTHLRLIASASEEYAMTPGQIIAPGPGEQEEA